jgi:hypothetical protein
MGNKSQGEYNSIPPDDILADFNNIKTKEDAVKWIKANFKLNDALLRVISDLQHPDCSLHRKSYSYVNKTNKIAIYFGLYNRRTKSDLGWGTSFQYSPSIKS